MRITFTLSWFIFCFLVVGAAPALAQSVLPGSGNCLRLDGVDDYLLAGTGNRGVSNKLTVEAWIKTSSTQLSWIAGKYSNSNGEDAGYELLLSNGYAVLYGRDKSNTYLSSGLSSTRVSDNRWHHIAGVFNAGRWEIWVDGIMENSFTSASKQGSLATVAPHFSIGFYQEFNNLFFQGSIDEVRVWNVARSQDEIRKTMCQKLTGKEANLVGYFPFDSTEDKETFPDLSPSKLGASLVNATSSQVQTLSGAPIGNASEFFYPNDWNNARFEILGKHTFQVFFPSANAKGIHLYRVDSPPQTRAGINNGTLPDFYYRVFTLGSAQPISYTVNYKAFEGSRCYNLYSRKDNAVTNWGVLSTTNMPAAITLNKAGETDRGEYLLNTNELPSMTILFPDVLCEGPKIATARGPGKGTYLWSTGDTTSGIMIKQPGMYSVRFTLPGGCYEEIPFTVKPGLLPAFNLGRDTLLCPGSSLVLKGPAETGLSYKWQDGSTAPTKTVSAPGWYKLQISRNGCMQTDSVLVGYYPKVQVNLGADTTLCAGKTLLLSAGNPGMKYRWQDNTTANTYQVTRPGTYWVDVETPAGCITRDSIRVVYLTPPVVSLGKDTTLCEGQTLTLTRKLPGVKYLWQDGSTQESITITRPGKYWLRASVDVCSESDTLEVRYQANPPVVMSGDTLMCRGGKLLLSVSVPGASYRWQDGSTASSFLVEQEGEYSVAVTLGNCTTTSTKRVRYQDCVPFIPNIITPNGDQANETFLIRNVDPKEWSLEIFNRWGQRVFQADRYGNDWKAKGLSEGTYFYRLINSSRGLTYKGHVEVIK